MEIINKVALARKFSSFSIHDCFLMIENKAKQLAAQNQGKALCRIGDETFFLGWRDIASQEFIYGYKLHWFEFLFRLKKSGVVNMYHAGFVLQQVYELTDQMMWEVMVIYFKHYDMIEGALGSIAYFHRDGRVLSWDLVDEMFKSLQEDSSSQ